MAVPFWSVLKLLLDELSSIEIHVFRFSFYHLLFCALISSFCCRASSFFLLSPSLFVIKTFLLARCSLSQVMMELAWHQSGCVLNTFEKCRDSENVIRKDWEEIRETVSSPEWHASRVRKPWGIWWKSDFEWRRSEERRECRENHKAPKENLWPQ